MATATATRPRPGPMVQQVDRPPEREQKVVHPSQFVTGPPKAVYSKAMRGASGSGRTRVRIVAVEFIAAIVVLGLGYMFNKDDTIKTWAVRTCAVCLVYTVLAMLAAGDTSGRPAAAFGGLVLAGVVFSERDMLVQVASIFPKPKGAK